MPLEIRLAVPEQIPAGDWDTCPYCTAMVWLPKAGSKDAKAWVRCPQCGALIKPDC